MRINIFFAWYNLWSAYTDRSKAIYICLLPMIVIKIAPLSAPMKLKKVAHRWHLILHKSMALGRGQYPGTRFVIFDYFDVGPLQIRRYICEDWDFQTD